MSSDGLPAPSADWALFLDFDGTLVEIAASPDDVRVDAALPERLSEIERRLNGALAVISGRPVGTLDHYLGRRFAAAGLHGMEIRTAPEAPLSHAQRHEEIDIARERLAPFVAEHAGLLLEDKVATVALHYRARPELKDACGMAVQEALEDLEGVHALAGRMVFEIKPSNVNKGIAVETLMKEAAFRGRRPIFAGDDVTDEDGFAIVQSLGGFGIKIGDGETRAFGRISSVNQLHTWLAHLEAALPDGYDAEGPS